MLEQAKFGWGLEDMEMVIADMASTGKESTFCMGDDTPLAVLSSKPHVLYNYFKQRFAQVSAGPSLLKPMPVQADRRSRVCRSPTRPSIL
jgi:hypothetical protein